MMEPERFGHYTLLRRLAIGGMGELFLAQRSGSASYSSLVVVKRIRADLLDEEGFVEMFLNEGRVAALIDHPNVVRIYELGQVEGAYFIAMEYVAGKDLGTLLKQRDAPLDLATSIYVMVSVCEGLGFAHGAAGNDGEPLQIVHRDINPQNVLTSYSGAVKLTDFGIAKVQMQHRQKTRAGVLKGKFGYLSPEQARGMPVDQRSDIYALGLLLFEITVGRRANPGRNDSEMLFSAAEGRLLYPTQIVEGYPPALEQIYRTATAERPEHRYQTVRQLQEALLAFQLEHRVIATAGMLADVMQKTFARDWSEERRAMTPTGKSSLAAPRPPDREVATGPYAAPGLRRSSGEQKAPDLAMAETYSKELLLQGSAGAAPESWGVRTGTRAVSPTQIGMNPAASPLQDRPTIAPPSREARRQGGRPDQTGPGTSPSGPDQTGPATPRRPTGAAHRAAAPPPGSLRPLPSEPELIVDRPVLGEFEEGPTMLGPPGSPELLRDLIGGVEVNPQPSFTAPDRSASRSGRAGVEGSKQKAAPVPQPAPVRPGRPGRGVVILGSLLFTLGLGGGLAYMLLGSTPSSKRGGSSSGSAGRSDRQQVRVSPLASPDARLAAASQADRQPSQALDRGALATSTPADAGSLEPEGGVTPPAEVGPGQLKVSANAALQVFWRGRRLGSTPLQATLPAGRQTLVLRNPTLHIELTRRVLVSTDRRALLEVNVGKGKLDLRVRPWAHVEIEGQRRGTTPMQPIELYEGRYTIRLVNPEFPKPHQARIIIRPGETSRVVHVFKKE